MKRRLLSLPAVTVFEIAEDDKMADARYQIVINAGGEEQVRRVLLLGGPSLDGTLAELKAAIAVIEATKFAATPA